MNTKNKKLILCLLIVLVSNFSGAQPPPGFAAPIDGGIISLLCLGLLYGVYRLIKGKKD